MNNLIIDLYIFKCFLVLKYITQAQQFPAKNVFDADGLLRKVPRTSLRIKDTIQMTFNWGVQSMVI